MHVLQTVVLFAVLPAGAETMNSIAAALEFMHRNFNRQAKVSEFARAAGMSTSHFSRRFTLSIGRSPASYVRSLRTAAARALIQNTGMPLSQIAAAVGFSDQSHLSSAFRDEYGETPAECRRQG